MSNYAADRPAHDRTHDQDRAGPTSWPYIRFGLMIVTSSVVMLGLMYLNTYAWEHVRFSETRTWMAVYMGGAMAIVMLAFMMGMMTNKTLNIAIFAGAAVAMAIGVWVVRSQVFMDDIDYMKAMIPHHSIAILTSERSDITDPRVRALADEIIEVQRAEIAEMEFYIRDIQASGEAPPGTPRRKAE